MQCALDTYLGFYTDKNHLCSHLEMRHNHLNWDNFESRDNRFDSLQSPDCIHIDSQNSPRSQLSMGCNLRNKYQNTRWPWSDY